MWLKIKTADIFDWINHFAWNLQWTLMVIIRILFVSRDKICDVIRLNAVKSESKKCFNAFGQCFRLCFDTALQKGKNMLTSYL